MSDSPKRNHYQSAIYFLRSYFLFFCTIAFVITCTFLFSFSSVDLPEADIRAFAPIAFFNIFILSALFVTIDLIRRQITVYKPAQEIQKVLEQLKRGDFSARVHLNHTINRETHFKDIAESINLMAEELTGVETLRSDFIANVSHELKTPLAVMQNYGTLLQQPDLTNAQRLEYSKAITDTSRRLAQLITNILKLNKLENQQIFPTAAKYDLSEQLCECLLQFENIWEIGEIEIDTQIEDGVHITADAELLSLVWNNLLSNAFKFTAKGGKVTVSLIQTTRYATVKITDTGCGMTPEVGAHIFEKFYQGDTSHATHGNGLGLALVKRVIDILHGEISVESVHGQGSTFTVTIEKELS